MAQCRHAWIHGAGVSLHQDARRAQCRAPAAGGRPRSARRCAGSSRSACSASDGWCTRSTPPTCPSRAHSGARRVRVRCKDGFAARMSSSQDGRIQRAHVSCLKAHGGAHRAGRRDGRPPRRARQRRAALRRRRRRHRRRPPRRPPRAARRGPRAAASAPAPARRREQPARSAPASLLRRRSTLWPAGGQERSLARRGARSTSQPPNASIIPGHAARAAVACTC